MNNNSKNVLIINDMPGYSKVAMAAMLPILSHMGHSVYNLPTALVSNTLDYGTFTILDTTDYMEKTIEVWDRLGFQFDCITTGFLASAKQVDIIRRFIESQKKENLLVMTDPIMGDDGSLYNGVGEDTVENMRRLIGVADVIVPNLTEAEFLTGLYCGQKALTAAQAREMVDALRKFGPRTVIVTSGMDADSGENVVWGYDHQTNEYFTIPYRLIRVHFPGTGDMFSAVLVGELLRGTSLQAAVKRAMDVLEKLVFLEKDELEKNKGIRIEKFLDVLND
ncbi:MAG: pyridoxamine kinase [Oscillospiraceae bacterium]|nr:pyridoxamine kinase [Oscillospiraceae bacterium]